MKVRATHPINITISLETLNGETELYAKECEDPKSENDKVTMRDISKVLEQEKRVGKLDDVYFSRNGGRDSIIY